ncbi:MAG: LLM class flavin-dependent oxidoreductase [Acidimicrobiales bacterium]|nr:LLM class flavin-dependent oxidoreductase [Acidimicrobiales bacterium]HRW37792.1 LLM class flavin-dependent oxidoreductase [Aquihabitans sp.]
MPIGIRIVHPPAATATAALRTAAQAAEALGYRTLWAADDLRASAPPGPDRPPAPLDGPATLAHLAALTSRVRLGLAGLDAAERRANALVGALASIDHLSAGRLTVSALAGDGGTTLGELLATSDRQWPVTPTLDHEPAIGPPPYQRPRPPLLAIVRPGDELTDAHRRADGLHLVGPWAPAAAAEVWDEVRTEGAELVVQVEVDPSDPAAATEAITAAHRLEPTEIVLAAPDDTGLDEALAAYADVAELVELRAGA